MTMEAARAAQEFRDTLECIAETLNEAVVAICGEAAEWEPGPPYPGIEKEHYEISRAVVKLICRAREDANSALFWEDNGILNEIAKFEANLQTLAGNDSEASEI